MASVKLNPVLQSIHGMVGNLVVKKLNGKVFIARKPDMSRRVLSPAQRDTVKKFRLATVYGKMAMKDPQARAAYRLAAQERMKPAFSLTITDFFNPPSVDEIDLAGYNGQPGGTIAIQATDDFEVMSVEVRIVTMTGDPIEDGSAVKLVNMGRWLYTTTASIPIGTRVRVEATATDRPGNKTTRTENI